MAAVVLPVTLELGMSKLGIVEQFTACLLLVACGRNSDIPIPQIEETQLNHGKVPSDDNVNFDLKLEAPERFKLKYFAAADNGMRADGSGHGAMLAPRGGGRLHNGVDFLMPVGTNLIAPCTGSVLSGYEGSFGNWVQLVCPFPSPRGSGSAVYASLLMAHLTTRITANSWQQISAGTSVGTSGSTGNARGTNPHVHFELTLHQTRSSAQNDLHGSLKSTPTHTKAFAETFAKVCRDGLGFRFLRSGKLVYGDRVDPFAFFSCFAQGKPSLSQSRTQMTIKWSEYYTASKYDVNTGQIAPKIFN